MTLDGVKPVELQEPLAELARDPTRFAHDLEFPPADTIRVYDDTLRESVPDDFLDLLGKLS